jgi:hypothetical protein
MARKFVDTGPSGADPAIQDGTALTLTNTTGVRVLWDDTATSSSILVALEKAKLAILANET